MSRCVPAPGRAEATAFAWDGEPSHPAQLSRSAERVRDAVVRRVASAARLCRSSVRRARRAQPLAGARATRRVSAASARPSCADPK